MVKCANDSYYQRFFAFFVLMVLSIKILSVSALLKFAIDNHSHRLHSFFNVGKFVSSMMFVCNCNGIREREVVAVIDAGVTRWRDILAEFECTPCCGKCEDDINLIIEQKS